MRKNLIIQRIGRIPAHWYVFSLFIVFICSVQTGSATIFLQDGTEIPGEQFSEMIENSSIMYLYGTPSPFRFFYNTHCGSCHAALQYLEDFSQRNPKVRIGFYDLHNSTENSVLFDQYRGQFNRSHIHYPVIFAGPIGITGSDDIVTYTEPLSEWYLKNEKNDPVTTILSLITAFFQGFTQ